MEKVKSRRNNSSFIEVEKILKNQKIVFALWNASSKKDSHYQNYYLPLKKLFRKVIMFDPRKIRFSYGSKSMNEKLISLIKKEKPDYIFLIFGRDELNIEVAKKIKVAHPKIKIISFVGDDDTQFETIKRYQALFADCSFIAQPKYKSRYFKEGIKNVYSNYGVANTHIFRPLELEKKYDVTFIGQPSEPRIAVIKFLIKNEVNIKIFGRGWEAYPELEKFCHGPLETEEMVKVINQTKINLALSKNKFGVLHFKGRIFEFMACKSFCLTDYFKDYAELLKEGKEIVMFKDDNDLLKKIDYYLRNEKEREEISKKGYEKTMLNHSILIEYKKMFKQIINNENVFTQKPLKTKKKITTINKQDINKKIEDIQEMLRDFDYVSFNDGDSKPLKYKNFIQIYSLEKTKKDISCCDYYIYNKSVGKYLLSNSHKAFLKFEKNKFSKLISINQIAMSKKYFLKNLEKIREFFDGGEIDLISEKNTCFISIPLIKMKKLPKMNYNLFSYSFQKIFMIHIYSMIKQKKIFDPYLYKMAFLVLRDSLLKKSAIEFITDRRNWNQLRI